MKLNRLSISILFFVLLSSTVFGNCIFLGNEVDGYFIDENISCATNPCDDCVFDCLSEGIDLSNGNPSPTSKGIHVRDNPSTGWWSMVTVQNCEISNWGIGISVTDSYKTKLEDNSIHNNDIGIQLVDNTHTYLNYNTVTYNLLQGILMLNNNYTIGEGNIVSRNYGNGFDLEYNYDTNLLHNTAKYNQQDGIFLYENNETLLNNNTVRNNQRYGIWNWISDETMIFANTACNNAVGDFQCQGDSGDNAWGMGNYFDGVTMCPNSWPQQCEEGQICPGDCDPVCDYMPCCPLGPPLGDMNDDGFWNVLDIVQLANCILDQNCGDTPSYSCAGDLNGDGGWSVLDIVNLANCVLAQNCGG